MKSRFTINQSIKYAACVGMLSLFSAVANAVPVSWTLDGVVFADGSTASGSFTFDADTSTYSSVNIVTTPGTVITSGNTFDTIPPQPNLNCGTPAFTCAVNASAGPDYLGDPVIRLQFSTPLTNAGGTITLVGQTINAICGSSALCAPPLGASTLFSAGSVNGVVLPPPSVDPAAAVPIPAISVYGLAITILGLLAIASRRLSSRGTKAAG